MLFEIIKNEYIALTHPSKNTSYLMLKGVRMYLNNPKFRVICMIRKIVNSEPYSAKRKKLSNRLMNRTGVEIGDGCVIGENLKIEHYNGIVIGKKTVMGNNCTLYQQVTIGKKNNEYPKIGDNVVIYPGAKILGGIHIGDGAVIGANAVVLKDVESKTTVAGCPAKVINSRN